MHALFVGPSAAEAERLLAEECAESVPLWSENSPHGLERIRFAAIRLSGGELPRLVDGIELAHKDWRDLLDAARFAGSAWSHRFWKPRRFDGGVAARWRKGERIANVSFALGQAVKVSLGPYMSEQGIAGTVTELIGLEPQPRYKVSLERGDSVELLQCHVKTAR